MSPTKWEYNTIDQRNYLKGELSEDKSTFRGTEVTEDSIDELLNSFGQDGWELVGWYGVWFIFKRKLD